MVAFILAFVAMLIWSYIKDSKKTKHFYKGSYKAVLGIVGAAIATYVVVRMIILFKS